MPAGWLIALWCSGALRLLSTKLKPEAAGLSRVDFIGGLALLGIFSIGLVFSSALESNLGYYQRAMQGDPSQRITHYDFRPGLLPESINRVVRSTLWNDEREIGRGYLGFTYLLWHESRVFEPLEKMVAVIQSESRPDGEIFGDSSTVPLLALESGRQIAGNQVDTNIQRFRNDQRARASLLMSIDSEKTELLVLRDRFGVAGLSEIQQLVRQKYSPIATFRVSEESAVYRIYKRVSVN